MRPGTLAGLTGVVAGAAAVVASGITPAATTVGILGVVCMVFGTFRDRGLAVAVGGLALGGAVLLAGHAGASSASLVAAVAAGVLSYDQFDAARTYRRTFDAAAVTARGEAAHAAGVTLVVGLFAGGAFAVYTLVAGRTSTLAVGLLVVGASALTAALWLEP